MSLLILKLPRGHNESVSVSSSLVIGEGQGVQTLMKHMLASFTGMMFHMYISNI